MSNIEWTQKTWNPTTGCDKVSAGCKFCYAETMSNRLYHMGSEKYKSKFQLKLHPKELFLPYTWKKPRVVFVNSMSDLFHEDVPVNFINEVFKVMRETPMHTYQILTKRSKRLEELSDQLIWTDNIWMGVSVEEEKVADRITHLSNTGAKVKFLSIEPLIGHLKSLNLKKIDWVIVGGESGHKARPMHEDWVENIQLKCKSNRVPFFFKQWGNKANNPNRKDPTLNKEHNDYAKGGCQLKGIVHREMPNVHSLTKR